ncbi:hypothetical protein DYH56_15470 [Psychrilyobacter piezotolerans]|uniref:Uncharacterized protein n=1 Tax=Psychrilyobacter piezotolerans TaxID=2293438 RepID=A0ABX9KD96_9FUSO|nr:hypothetical protein DV867_15470 [Psychrilyobacter sp. S5]REI39261.1 hypothetical protein DYH56_15470 [Psychrilyobacter piezotolerans]
MRILEDGNEQALRRDEDGGIAVFEDGDHGEERLLQEVVELRGEVFHENLRDHEARDNRRRVCAAHPVKRVLVDLLERQLEGFLQDLLEFLQYELEVVPDEAAERWWRLEYVSRDAVGLVHLVAEINLKGGVDYDHEQEGVVAQSLERDC